MNQPWIRSVLLVFAGVLAIGPVIQAPSDDWPAWRVDGNGVASNCQLPAVWDGHTHIKWKSPIAGDGISSPIVQGDNVYLTTAIPGSGDRLSKANVIWTSLGLAVVATLGGLASLVRRRDGPSLTGAPVGARFAYAIDRLAALGAFLLFGVALLLVGRRLFGDEIVPFQGDVARAWMHGGALAASGMMAAFAFISPRSGFRLIGAALLLAAAAVFHLRAPRDMYTNVMPLTDLAKVSGPMIVAALWFVIMFFVSRRILKLPARPVRAARTLFPLAVLALSGLLFAYFNFLQPETGLWRCVVCLDKHSGEMKWTSRAFLAPAERKYRANSFATPTPVTDGRFIVAAFGHGLACMDMEGNVKWTRMEPNYLKYLRYGSGSSPVICGNRVIFTFMAELWIAGEGYGMYPELIDNSYLAALDLETGRELWRARPPQAHDSYCTPVIVSDGDRTSVLITTYDHGLAYDLETGQLNWTVLMPMTQPVPSFVTEPENGVVYMTGGIHGPGGAARIRLGGRDDVTSTHVDWMVQTGVTGVSSPVLVDGRLYWVTETGILSSVDAASGKRLWRKRLREGGVYHSSPVAGDGKIFITNSDGICSVIRSAPEFELLAENELGESSCSSPAISGNCLFIRGQKNLYCIQGTDVPVPKA